MCGNCILWSENQKGKFKYYGLIDQMTSVRQFIISLSISIDSKMKQVIFALRILSHLLYLSLYYYYDIVIIFCSYHSVAFGISDHKWIDRYKKWDWRKKIQFAKGIVLNHPQQLNREIHYFTTCGINGYASVRCYYKSPFCFCRSLDEGRIERTLSKVIPRWLSIILIW